MSKSEIKTLYRCGSCRDVHEDEDEARECCAPSISEVYACPVCGEIHEEESEAGECCGFETVQCPNCRRDYGAGHINHSAVKIAGHCNTCNPFFSVDQQLAIEDLHCMDVARWRTPSSLNA